MRVAFFGTPDFAVPALEALAAKHDVAVVVAQPDRPAGRGLQLHAPPVALKARDLALPLMQPAKIRDRAFLGAVEAHAPDVGVVVAYGRILPAALLAIPRHGFLNIHASLLPKYRGAAPIQRAIAAGESETGVTIMRVDAELDHGPILATRRVSIGADEHAPSLAARLAKEGAAALLEVLAAIDAGTVAESEQDHSNATHAPKVEKHEGEIRWTERTRSIYDRHRAFDPWPGTYVMSGGEAIKLIDVRPATGVGGPGTILAMAHDTVTIATADGALELHTIQRPGRPRAAAPDVARGLGWRVGERVP